MKTVRFVVAVAVILSVFTISAPAALFKVKIKGTRYHTESPFEVLNTASFGNIDFIARCTETPGASLVAQCGSARDIPQFLLTVDECGNVICTNLIITSHCVQDAATSNGVSENDSIAARVHYQSPDDFYIGDGFMLTRTSGSPQDETVVNSYSTKGTFTFCTPTGDVINGSITINGLFKPAKNCPQ